MYDAPFGVGYKTVFRQKTSKHLNGKILCGLWLFFHRTDGWGHPSLQARSARVVNFTNGVSASASPYGMQALCHKKKHPP